MRTKVSSGPLSRIAKRSSKAVSIITILTLMLGGIPSSVFAARTTVSATVNGAASTTVATSTGVVIAVTGTLTSGDDWDGTEYQLSTSASPGAGWTCVDTPDHNSNGTYVETFTVLAPTTNGSYYLHVRVSGTDNCSGQTGTTFSSATPAVVVATPLFVDRFGSSNVQTVPGWTEFGTAGTNNTELTGNAGGGFGNEDETLTGVAGNKFAKIGEDEWICTTVNAVGYENLSVNYFYNGDDDAEASDSGVVEYKVSGACGDASGWTTAASENIESNTWSGHQQASITGADNGSFLLRVRASTSASDEYFRIDDVTVWGDSIPLGSVSGRVFNDLDGNGIDGAEPALTGWTVKLYQGATLVQSTTTTLTGYLFDDLSDGTYEVCEVLESGYYQTYPTTTPVCSEGTSRQEVTITGASDATLVNFGNAAHGALVVTVATDPDETDAAFGFTSSATTSPTFTIADSSSGNDGETFGSLVAGTYTLATTSVPEGWVFESASCSDGSPFDAIAIAPGETVTCTYTYAKPPMLTVQKVSTPGSGPFSIGVSGPTTTTLSLMANSSEVLSSIPTGTYTVSETIPEATAQTMTCVSTNVGNGSAQAAFSQTDGDISFSLGAGENMTCTVNNTPHSIIVGTKVEDTNGTGAGITGSGVSAWPFTLYKLIDDPETEGEDWVVSDTEDTNGSGSFTFTQVLPGTYKVCEGTQGGWFQSHPTAGATCSNGTTGYQLTIPDVPAAGAGETYGDGEGEGDSTFAFANYRKGTISGNKFEDVDADGVWDSPGEPGIDGWSIYLDLNENGTNDAEPTVVTSGGGHYEFENLNPGTYRIREVMPAATDWAQVVPSVGYYTETLVSGESASAFNFGNVHGGTISGFKWNDTDGDGVFEEEGVPGVAFTIELYRVSGETETLASTTLTSIGSGEYSFTNLLPGTYRVKEVSVSGWVQTYPLSGGYHEITLGVDEDVEGVKFGNAKVSTVSGVKYWDADKNSAYGEEEVLIGWTITATPMTDTDEGESVVLTVDSGRSTKTEITGEGGTYEFSFMPSDFGWWRLTEVQQVGWEQTAPTTTGYYDIQVVGDMAVTGKHFGNWKKPVVMVMKWSDADNDGIRDWNDATTTGSLGVKDEGEEYTEGLLAGWPIFVAEGYATDTPSTVDLHVIAMATTSAEGIATIYLPETGTFYVLEGKQDGWSRTYPTGSGAFGEDTVVVTFADGITTPTGFAVDTGTYFSIAAPTSGASVTTGTPAGLEEPATTLIFGNYDVPAPAAPSTGGSTGGGGGGNGPIAGSSGIAPGFVNTIIPTTGGGTSGGTGGAGAPEEGVGGSLDGDLGTQGGGTGDGTAGSSGGSSGSAGGSAGGGAGDGALEGEGGVLSDEAAASLAAAAEAFSNLESDASQLASAASTIGDLMETYWWLVALITLLLGSAWVAYQRYTA